MMLMTKMNPIQENPTARVLGVRAHRSQARVQQACCKALVEMAMYYENTAAIVDAGGMVVGAMMVLVIVPCRNTAAECCVISPAHTKATWWRSWPREASAY